jgi:hypothetical protein
MSRQSSTRTSDWLLGAVKQNPEGLLLLAAGACLLLRKTGSKALFAGHSSSTRSYSGDVGSHSSGSQRSGQSARGGFSQALSGAQDYASDIADRTMDTVGSVASTASDYASKAGRAVGEQSSRVAQQAQSTFEGAVSRILQDQPLAIAIAGVAAGAAVAAAFPATAFEREHLGAIGDQVTDAAYEVGDQLKEAAGRAGETLKSAIDQRGLNAEGLKDAATKVVTEVAGAFGGSPSGTGMSGGSSGGKGSSLSGGGTSSTSSDRSTHGSQSGGSTSSNRPGGPGRT